jgi:hypothetical protein
VPWKVEVVRDGTVACGLTASPVYLDSAETVGTETRVVPIFGLTLVPNVGVDRVLVRREVSGCVNGRERRVLAVATLALAGTLPWASVAA